MNCISGSDNCEGKKGLVYHIPEHIPQKCEASGDLEELTLFPNSYWNTVLFFFKRFKKELLVSEWVGRVIISGCQGHKIQKPCYPLLYSVLLSFHDPSQMLCLL